VWPNFYDCSIDILTKAYEQVIPGSIDADTQVDKVQFPSVLGSVYWYAKLHRTFAEVLASRRPSSGRHSGERACKSCGSLLLPDSDFCRRCGAKWIHESLADDELSKQELRTFDWCISLSDHEVDVLWSQLDKAHVGRVKIHELCVAMYLRLGRAEAMASGFFHFFDYNHDGRIFADEWLSRFDSLDQNGSGQVSRMEWINSGLEAGLFDAIKAGSASTRHMTRVDWANALAKCDADADGYVTVREFCNVLGHPIHGHHEVLGHPIHGYHELLGLAGLPLTHASSLDAEGSTQHLATRDKKKTLGDFDQLEKQMKRICFSPRDKMFEKMWGLLDQNRKGSVSLQEAEKMVVEVFPLLSYKPALTQAFQDSTGRTPGTLQSPRSGGPRICRNCGNQLKDDSLYCRKCGARVEVEEAAAVVEKEEMKKYLLNAFYYNKFFWLFNVVGANRPMDFQQWHFCSTLSGEKLMPNASRAEFAGLGRFVDGQVPFEAFCAYIVAKQCLLSGVTL